MLTSHDRQLRGPVRALLVIDQAALADSVRLALNHGHCSMRVAPTVDDAAHALNEWRPHLVVLDMDIAASPILERLADGPRERDRLPVIALTRRSDLHGKLAAFAQGVDDVLSVPFAPEELVARVLAIMRRTYRDAVVFTPGLRLGDVDIDILNRPVPKHVLAWADVRNGYQHDAVSHALATIEWLGRESGTYDTFIRTDSQLITKRSIEFPAGTGIAAGEQFNVRNLNYFDAIFFFGVREIDLTADQRTDLLSFIKDDGKGFVAAHSAATAFFSWPEFGDMLGGRFDEHPWGIADGTVVIDDPAFPAMRHFKARTVVHDELYQIKDFSRDKIRVLAHLDASRLDLSSPLVHRTDGDFPVAWAKHYGRGRVFYAMFGHGTDDWDNPALRTLYFEALRWALGLVEGDATPRP